MDARGAERLRLTLNEKKTSIRDARRERFDFLGYTLGPHCRLRTGREYIGYSPSDHSVGRLQPSVGELLRPDNVDPWEQVRRKRNQKLRGWKQYFRQGSTRMAHRAVDEHVYERVRHFLRRRRKVLSPSTHPLSSQRGSGPLGVMRLEPRSARS